jgi:hypothetical protein
MLGAPQSAKTVTFRVDTAGVVTVVYGEGQRGRSGVAKGEVEGGDDRVPRGTMRFLAALSVMVRFANTALRVERRVR